jgi:hypothetical protein
MVMVMVTVTVMVTVKVMVMHPHANSKCGSDSRQLRYYTANQTSGTRQVRQQARDRRKLQRLFPAISVEIQLRSHPEHTENV